MRTTRLSEELAPKTFIANSNKVVGDGGSRANKTIRNSSRNLTCMLNIGALKELNFLTPDAKKVFNYLRLAFIKAPIL